MGFEVVGGDLDVGLGCGDAVVDDERGWHFAQAHEEEVEEANGGSGNSSLQPEVEEIDEKQEEDEADDSGGRQ